MDPKGVKPQQRGRGCEERLEALTKKDLEDQRRIYRRWGPRRRRLGGLSKNEEVHRQ